MRRGQSTQGFLDDSLPSLILRTLDETGWIVGGTHGAAKRLGLPRTSLVSKMKKLGISKVFIALEVWHPNKTTNNTIIAFAFGALVLAFLRRNLIPLMLVGTITFTLLYFGLFLWVLFLYLRIRQALLQSTESYRHLYSRSADRRTFVCRNGRSNLERSYEYFYGYRLETAGVI